MHCSWDWKSLKRFNTFAFLVSSPYICSTKANEKNMSKSKMNKAMDSKRVIVVNERKVKGKDGEMKVISTIAPLK